MDHWTKQTVIFFAVVLLPLPLFGMKTAAEMAEHVSAMALADPAEATHIATQNGNWSDAATWGGSAPGVGDRVHIPMGISVTVDAVLPDTYRTIRVDGSLNFATDVNTELRYDTYVGSMMSSLTIGTEANPIQSGVTARVLVEDIGDFVIDDAASPDYDPRHLGLGMIQMGSLTVHGMEREASASFVGAKAGDTVLSVDRVPSNWVLGDEIVIANAKRDATGDEVRTITGLDAAARTMTLDSALEEDHITPRHTVEGLTLRMHIINLTRNIIFETADVNDNREHSALFDTVDSSGAAITVPELSRRGHNMFMHNNNVSIKYAKFFEMGRTDKNQKYLKNASIDETGTVIKPAGNPVARYPVHFHRAGASTALAVVEGCVVQASPGWGYVNHSSACAINNNVAYDVDGSAFVSEAGDEVGEFIGNVAIKMHGASFGAENTNAHNERFGNNGVGFWIESKMVRVEHNVASGFYDNGFQLWNEGIDDVSARFTEQADARFASDPELEDTITVDSNRAYLIKNNMAYGGHTGMQVAFGNNGHWLPVPHAAWNHVRNFTAYAVTGGFRKKYSNKFVLINYIAIGDLDDPQGFVVESHVNSSGFNYINCHFEGFAQGMENGSKSAAGGVSGGYYNNVNNFSMQKFHNRWCAFNIGGDVKFGELSTAALNGRAQVDFAGTATYSQDNDDLSEANLNHYTMGITGAGGPFEAYLEIEQDAAFIPFATGGKYDGRVPSAMMDITNDALTQFSNSYAQAITPETAIEVGDFTYENMLHDPIAALPMDMKIFRYNTLPNLLLPVGTTQTIIDVSDIFIDPIHQPIHLTVDTNTNPGLVNATLVGTTLTLDYNGTSTGECVIRILGTSTNRPSTSPTAIDGFKVEILATMPALPPTTMADTYDTTQDVVLNQSAGSGVLANDIEPNGENMSAQIEQGPAHGTLEFSADGSFTYTPDATFSGTDTFMYRAGDGNEFSDFTTVTIDVANTMNDAPVANDDSSTSYAVFQGDTLVISRVIDGLLVNDRDPERQELSVDSYTQPDNGTLMLNTDGTFEYTSSLTFKGLDTFTYTITDGANTSTSATVSIEVNGPIPVEVFAEDWETSDYELPANPNDWSAGLGGLLVSNANENPFESGLKLMRLQSGDPDRASIETGFNTSLYENISIQYQRDTKLLVAPFYFISQWSDDGGATWTTMETLDGDSAWAEVSFLLPASSHNNPNMRIRFEVYSKRRSEQANIDNIKVMGTLINTTPISNDDGPYVVDEDTPLIITDPDLGILSNDTDAELDQLKAVLVTNPAHGQLSLNANGTFIYTPGNEFYGSDSFTYVAADLRVNSAPATVTISINPVDDGPVPEHDTASVSMNHPNGVMIDVLSNDAEFDGEPMSVVSVDAPANGSVVINGNNTITYTPDIGFAGPTDTFTYIMTDGNSNQPASVTVQITEQVPVETLVALFVEDWETGDYQLPGNLNNWIAGDGGKQMAGAVENPFNSGSFLMRLKNGNPDLASMETGFSTELYENISIQYQRDTKLLDSPYYFISQWSSNGGATWHTMETLNGTSAWAEVSFLLPAAANNNPDIRIRFEVYSKLNKEQSNFDNIKVTGTLIGTNEGYSTWIAGYAGVGEQIAAGDDADSDGMSNFLEYAFKADPTLADAAAKMPSITAEESLIHFTFYRGQADLTYQIEKSTDLGDPESWTVYGASNPGTVDTSVDVAVPLSEGVDGRLFLRLKVSE